VATFGSRGHRCPELAARSPSVLEDLSVWSLPDRLSKRKHRSWSPRRSCPVRYDDYPAEWTLLSGGNNETCR